MPCRPGRGRQSEASFEAVVARTLATRRGLVVAMGLLAFGCLMPSALTAQTTATSTTSSAGTATAGGSAAPTSSSGSSSSPDYACQAPHAMPYDLTTVDQVGADAFSWQSFLALNAGSFGPQWATWRSSGDLIDCNQSQPPADGSCNNGFHFPEACQAIKNYTDYQVLDQVGKVDDGLFEADVKGLSGSPVITADGTFLRYVILLSPPLTSWMLGQSLQKEVTLDFMQKSMHPVEFLCSDPKVVGSNLQSVILKLAWMETPKGRAADFYTQDLLVHTPAWRSSTGEATCVKQSMSLVGMHIARKTAKQPSWVWSTFEHKDNAPDCTALPGAGDQNGGKGPSRACPSTVSQDWNFYAKSCQPDGQGGGCQSCNTAPLPNGKAGACVNPNTQANYDAEQAAYEKTHQAWVKGGSQGAEPTAPAPPPSWCMDRGPASLKGKSRLCRQVGPGSYYAGATSWDTTPPNAACQPKNSVWGNYQLISTQFSVADYSSAAYCANVQEDLWGDAPKIAWPVVSHQVIRPLVSGLDGKDGKSRPFLANSSMESYERANCLGCHAKSTIQETIGGKDSVLPTSSQEPKSPGTDFIYFLGVEVPAFEPKAVASGSTASPTATSPTATSSAATSGQD